MHKALENLKPSYGGFSSALGGETTIADTIQSATYVDMRYYDLAVAYGQASGVAAGSVITLQLYEGTSTAGAGSATLSGKTDTFTSTNTTDTDVLQAEVRGQELSAGYRYVGARLSTSNASGTEKVSLILLQGRPRFAQNTLP